MMKLNVDCLNLTFNELQTDKKSLHSCLLVNREWCIVAVPILWKNHSWRNEHQSHESREKIFDTIFSFLPSSSKRLLSDKGIKLPSTVLLKPPSFNYINFCEFPGPKIINHTIMMLLENKVYDDDKRNLLEQELYKLFIDQCKNVTRLSWQTRQDLSFFPGATTCFSQLSSLSVNLYLNDSDALYEMAKICKDLNELTIHNCSRDFPALISLIDAQRNLKSVIFFIYTIEGGICKELGKALARKGNTISKFFLYTISIIPPSFLTSLINLKDLTIVNDRGIEDIRVSFETFRQYLAILKFSDLQSLEVQGLPCFKELAMLIEKTEGNVVKVIVENTNRANKDDKNVGKLIKAISNNCPKIVQLSTHLGPEDFIHVKLLLLNCKSLVHLELENSNNVVVENNNVGNVGDELLDILAKFSPKSLTNVTISGRWKCSIDAYERFFESYRERALLHFDLTYNINQSYITEGHKIIIRKYIDEGVIEEPNNDVFIRY